jgi:hypothetical protein
MALACTSAAGAAVPACPCTFWSTEVAPRLGGSADPRPVEVGLKFYADINGFITGMRFYKSAANTGPHVASLWTIDGALIARASFVNESASGWQQVNFPAPVAIAAGTRYVASYHTTTGHYAVDIGYFSASGVDSSPLHTPRNGAEGANGLYTYSADSAFPSRGFVSTNYWVDVMFTTTPTTASSPQPVGGGAPRDFKVGANIHIGPNFNRDDLYWPRFDELLLGSFRTNFNWSWVEQQPGQFNVNMTPASGTGSLYWEDSMLHVGNTVGIAPLIVLGFGNKLYDGGGFPVSDAAQAAFVRYATFVANRFKGDVKYYELWNEWNIGGGIYPAVHGDPTVYARLLKKVYAALKAVDPQIVVIAGAASGQDLGWPQTMMLAGGNAAMDGYSVHPYNLPDVPEQALAYLQTLEATLKVASGGREVPIYVSEIGWATGTDNSALSPATVADYLARIYLAAPMYSYLKGIWWYDFLDDGADLSNVHQNFGLYDTGWQKKPAACAMGDIAKLLAGYAPMSLTVNARGVWQARYSNGANSVFALWTQVPGTTVSAAVTTSGPSGASINGRGICKAANVTGNDTPTLRAVISNSPTLFTTIADSISIQ